VAYQKNWAESGIAMLGPTESGKSTFLCALRKALLEQEEEWMLFTRDPASQRRLEEMSSALVSEGGFPLPTRTVDTIQWILAGPVERKERKGGRFSQLTTIKDRVEITLRLTDAPGGLGRADRIGLTERNDLIKQLADSRGILYMFDPIREHTHGDAFQRTESLLGELFGVLSGEPDFDGKLPHHLAVCVTKLDDPRVFKTAQDLDLLIPDHDSRWGFPRVHEADARKLFRALGQISRSGDGEAVPRLFERFFRPERINYYVTSAVGFMVNKRTRRFDPRDTANVYRTASDAPLVRGPVHPINVVEPVLWIIRQLAPLS
jgi:energy-coupling factor transporter ATP-binding protein EcfA2